MPSANVSGQVGNVRDFEVKAAGVLIYSKQETGSFPDFNAVSFVSKISPIKQQHVYTVEPLYSARPPLGNEILAYIEGWPYIRG